jgi:Tfp pilus assembly major pilin PilA
VTTASFLFTGFTLLCAMICAAAVYVCAAITLELQKDRGRVSNLEHELDAVSGQVHKLRQKIYATNSKPQTIEIATFEPPCENWLAAQTEGPTSRAANCDCAYCERQRAARADLRAKLRATTPQRKT